MSVTAGGPSIKPTSSDSCRSQVRASHSGTCELASLIPARFRLEGRRPTVTVKAAYSKHKREDEQPRRADEADMMRQYLFGKPPRSLIWPGTWKDAAAEMVRIDLEA